MTVMEHIAMGISDDFENEFTKNYLNNMIGRHKEEEK